MEPRPNTPKPVHDLWFWIGMVALLVVPLWWSATQENTRARRVAVADEVVVQLDIPQQSPGKINIPVKATLALWETDALHNQSRFTTATLLTTVNVTTENPTSITLKTVKKVFATVLDDHVVLPTDRPHESLPDETPGWTIVRAAPDTSIPVQRLRVVPVAP